MVKADSKLHKTASRGTLVVDPERERRLADYLAETDSVLERINNEQSSEDEDSFEETNSEITYADSVLLSPSTEAENIELLDYSESDSFDSEESEIDSAEEELWKKVRELSLVNVNRTPSKNEKKTSAKGSPKNSPVTQSTLSKKKSEKKINADENARFLAVLNGSFSSGKGKSEKIWKQSPVASVRVTSSGLVNGATLESLTPIKHLKGNNEVGEVVRNIYYKGTPIEKQLPWREPSSLIDSDSDDTETEYFSWNNGSTSTNSPRIGIPGSKRTTVSEPVAKSKSKNQIRKEKRREKEKRKEDNEPLEKSKSESVSIYYINGLINKFIKDPKLPSIALQPMDKAMRQSVHLLANAYNLKSKSQGAGDKRYPVLYRTKSTAIPRNHNKIRWILHSANSTTRNSKTPNGSTKPGKGGKGNSRNSTSTPLKARIYNPNSPVPPIGSIVGQFAKPIGESNIGHQMLQKMGWSPGEGLASSSSSGRTTPVEAIVRGRSRIGLGGAL